jgi:putative SOS response-associated peptidase YedK
MIMRPSGVVGLWDAWKDPKDGWLQSYSIITTDANEIMAPVHNRMPVILKPADYSRWLLREPGSAEGLGHGDPPLDLLRPFDADDMKAAPCNTKVGNAISLFGPQHLSLILSCDAQA